MCGGCAGVSGPQWEPRYPTRPGDAAPPPRPMGGRCLGFPPSADFSQPLLLGGAATRSDSGIKPPVGSPLCRVTRVLGPLAALRRPTSPLHDGGTLDSGIRPPSGTAPRGGPARAPIGPRARSGSGYLLPEEPCYDTKPRCHTAMVRVVITKKDVRLQRFV